MRMKEVKVEMARHKVLVMAHHKSHKTLVRMKDENVEINMRFKF